MDGHVEHPHPGEQLAEFLDDYNIDEQKLAAATGLNVDLIKKITQKKEPITPFVALKLDSYFETGTEFWLSLQANFDLAKKE